MIQRIALLAVLAFASVNAELVVNLGNECIANEIGGAHYGETFGACPDYNFTTSVTEECCVAQCSESLLAPPEVAALFHVCRGSDSGGAEVGTFDWADYCDCSFREYCNFACMSMCDTPIINNHNRVAGRVQSAAIYASTNNTEHDTFLFRLNHFSQNGCPVFFFAIFNTGLEVAIDWSRSALYEPFSYVGEAYSCDDIFVSFTEEEYPICGNDDIEEIGDKQCAIQLPAEFETEEQGIRLRGRYVAYTSCGFESVDLIPLDCADRLNYGI